jgi:hypothetical protein
MDIKFRYHEIRAIQTGGKTVYLGGSDAHQDRLNSVNM